ncbi:MAG: ATP-binding cassette subfamily F protein 3 [Patiriisocius sp.]|jgi:ATP-binding cassette subfamily F protein 3
MFSVNQISVFFGERVLFNEVSFFVSNKDKIGLTGKNGAGKSTMLKIVAGVDNPSKGDINLPNETVIGYLPQEMKHNEDKSIIEEASTAFSDINTFEEKINSITTELGEREDYESDAYMQLIEDLNHFNDRLDMLGSVSKEEQIEKVLKGLGFMDSDLNRQMSEFSGGWKMRVELAKILLQAPDVLLLDEPTNHLDIESISWLESFLQNHQGSILLISHDRAFLDNITNRTIEISNGKVYDYKFSYSKYIVQRESEVEIQLQAYKNQQKMIAETEVLINKFRAKKSKAAFAQSLIRKLDKLERIEVDHMDGSGMSMRFPPAPRSGKVAVELEDLQKSFGEKEIFSDVNLILPAGDKIALVGKNGAGKTTLLKILAERESHSGNFKIGHNIEIAYFAQNQAETLDVKKTVFETIDDEAIGEIRTKVRGILGSFLFGGDDIEKKVSVLSGGEKTRLALCKLLLKPSNLLILDEPTNHLDLKSKEVLKNALAAYDGTLIVVSHDRDFLTGLTNVIYEVKKDGLKQFIGDIYDFLKEKQATSIALFEKSEKAKVAKKESASANKRSYQEEKEYKKNVRKCENKINRCEKEISELEKKVAELDEVIAVMNYDDKENAEKVLGEYAQAKEKIDQLMSEWEEAESKLGKLNAS